MFRRIFSSIINRMSQAGAPVIRIIILIGRRLHLPQYCLKPLELMCFHKKVLTLAKTFSTNFSWREYISLLQPPTAEDTYTQQVTILTLVGLPHVARLTDVPYNKLCTRRTDGWTVPIEEVVERLILQPPDGKSASVMLPGTHKNSLFFVWFANYFIHLFLRTSASDRTKQVYGTFRPSLLYGSCPAEQEDIRTYNRGKVHLEDGFAPTLAYLAQVNGRIFEGNNAFPSLVNVHVGLVVVHTLLLREHNRLCDILFTTYPHYTDERIFDLARYGITNILLHIVRTEYITQLDSPFSPPTSSYAMGPNLLTRVLKSRLSPEVPSAISVEYLMTYVFHAGVPKSIDIDGYAPINTADTLRNIIPALDQFGNRQTCLAKLIAHGLSTPVHSLSSLYSTPRFMRHAEMAIMKTQAASCCVAYNDAREQLGLRRYVSFGDLCPDSATVEILESIYPSVDHIDFYTGIVIGNTFSSNPPLGDVARAVIASLAQGIIPVQHGVIQSMLPPVLHAEVRQSRERGFLSCLLNQHLPIHLQVPEHWSFSPLV